MYNKLCRVIYFGFSLWKSIVDLSKVIYHREIINMMTKKDKSLYLMLQCVRLPLLVRRFSIVCNSVTCTSVALRAGWRDWEWFWSPY